MAFWIDVDNEHGKAVTDAWRDRFSPKRLLREVKAKRRIVDRSELYARDLVKMMALPYSDHPDYREEWKP